MMDSTHSNDATAAPLTLEGLRRTVESIPQPEWTHAVEDPDESGVIRFYRWPNSPDPWLRPDYPHFSFVVRPNTAYRLFAEWQKRAADNGLSLALGGPVVIEADDDELRRWGKLCKVVHLVSLYPKQKISAEMMEGMRRSLGGVHAKTPPTLG